MKGSEGRSMKNDIEWLKEAIGELDLVDTVFESDGVSYIDTAVSVMQVYDLIEQLDEPEVLSQEENINIVLNDLKEYIKEQQSLSQNVGLAHTSAGNDTHYRQYDYVLECIDEYEPSDDLENLLVQKHEELESKIKVLIETYKQEDGAYSNPENGWISGFVEDLENLVEEEQKYYVIDKEDNILLIRGYGGIEKADNLKITNSGGGALKLTEQEIKDFDPRYWAFAKPVE